MSTLDLIASACVGCGEQVAATDQSLEFRFAMHNRCVPEYEAAYAEHLRDAAKDRVPFDHSTEGGCR